MFSKKYDYLYDVLIKQCEECMNIKLNCKSKKDRLLFLQWLNERKAMAYEYSLFLKRLGYDIDSCLEIGKTKYDSLIDYSDISICSPYLNSDNEKIINGSFSFVNECPYIKENGVIKRIDNFDTFLSFNQYSGSYDTFVDLHNSGKYNIILGVFGDTEDNDCESKINKLKSIKSELKLPYLENILFDRHNYYYTIGTKVMKRVK